VSAYEESDYVMDEFGDCGANGDQEADANGIGGAE
jgi:hypothetical protein